MAQSPLLTVGVWQKKSAELSCQKKDGLISAVNKGFNAMAAVLSKDSDSDEVQCALDFLSSERFIALRYDKSKDDFLRLLMYGVLESLHVSLKEWTEERNQVKETGEISTQTEESTQSLERNQRKQMSEISTQTDEDSLLPLLEPPLHDSCLPIDNNHSDDLTKPPPSFSTEPKEEPIDNHQSLTHDYQISASELMRDEKMFKEEEMANDDMIVPRDSMGEEINLDDVENSGMGDAVNDSLNEQPFEENDSLRTEINDLQIQPSDIIDYQINFYDKILGGPDLRLAERNSHNEVSMSGSHNETAEPEIDGEERGPVNDVIDSKRKVEEAVRHPTDTQKDTSDSVKNEKKRKSSRQASRTIQYNESMENSDGEDAGPSMKVSRSESSRKKTTSNHDEEESEDVIKKCRVSKKNETELECPECEYRTRTVKAWMAHLREKHSTTPALAGLALLCGCGNESVSEAHIRATNHSNTTVIRNRDGPIRRLGDNKATTQCVLCEMYPKTARGYVTHLKRHHKSTLIQNGIYLICSCGCEVRTNFHIQHLEECNPRQFTLHKLDNQ